jgi:large subunit ribosomal protein L10
MPNREGLLKIIPQQPAIILTKEDPFRFYIFVDRMKSAAPAKSGDIAPNDIVVTAGPTNLMPGPVISELSKAGISAGVEDGKIAVKRDATVAKKGDKISSVLASVLRKLNVEPMMVGLNIVGVYQNGMIYSKEALGFANTFVDKLKEAFSHALSLSVAICYPTKDNIKYLLAKAYNIASVFEKKFEEKVGGAK